MGFTIEAMARPFEALGYETLDTLPINGFLDKGIVKKDATVMQVAHALGMKISSHQ